MTVRRGGDDSIELVGACPSTDAEPLLQFLLATPGATVNWRDCQGAHTAVIQVLMAAKPRLRGPPADPRLEQWVAPAIRSPPEVEIASPGGIS
ncbi:MAG TPA: hypothetical protein VHV80_05695 [Steroidobacteraceae bacterium]|jgi:hypothetical protein|nr:hypothetical protein [Steroidobacteraceae bacterium]